MAVVFGAYYGFFFTLKGTLFGDRAFFASIATDVLVAIGIFFAWFSLVTAPLWNRRAKRNSWIELP
jgi:hypothetical protein